MFVTLFELKYSFLAKKGWQNLESQTGRWGHFILYFMTVTNMALVDVSVATVSVVTPFA